MTNQSEGPAVEKARHCPNCYALSRSFTLKPDGEPCGDPWHLPEEPATVAEAEGRVTHGEARSWANQWRPQLSVASDSLLRYIDQQEQSEREAIELRKEVASLQGQVVAACDQREALRSALTEAQARMAEAAEEIERNNTQWHDRWMRDQRVIRNLNDDGASLLAKLDALRAKPAQQAEQKPAQAEQKEPILPLCSRCGAIDGQCSGMGCLTKEEQAEPDNPAGERGDFRVGMRVTVIDFSRYHGKTFQIHSLGAAGSVRVELADGSILSLMPDDVTPDPAQPQPQGDLESRLIAALRELCIQENNAYGDKFGRLAKMLERKS